MKNLVKKIQWLAVFLAVSIFTLAYAQSLTAKTVKVTVDGTSPMHNWTMASTGGTFSGQVAGNAINNVKFTMPAKNLKSEKGKMMDNKAYDALKADKNPTITYTANTMAIGKSVMIGKLTVAGVTKTVNVPVTVTKTGNFYRIVGSSNMKMSDFGMATPGFMGIRTGDAVVVKIDITTN